MANKSLDTPAESLAKPPAELPDPDGFAAFWAVYDGEHEAVADLLEERLAEHPELGPALERTEDQRPQERDEGHRLLTAAAERGDWAPYCAYLRAQGARYAEAGVSFRGWVAVVRVFADILRTRIVEANHADPDALAAALRGLSEFTELGLTEIGETYLAGKEALIRQHNEAISDLSTPVLPVAEGMLVLPIVGVLDSRRAAQVTEQLLDGIRAHRARVAVVDITGVPGVDSAVANHLLQTVQAVRLMGAQALISGLSAVNAQVLVRIGVDLSLLHTVSDLQAAIEEAHRLLGRRTVAVGADGADGR